MKINLITTSIRIILIIIIFYAISKYGETLYKNSNKLQLLESNVEQVKKNKLKELEMIEKIKSEIKNKSELVEFYTRKVDKSKQRFNKTINKCERIKEKPIKRNLKFAFNKIIKKMNKFDKYVGGNSNCQFPKLENCCPLSFNKKIVGCTTDIISDRKHEDLGNPIESCNNANGYIDELDGEYICKPYLNELKGGKGWIQLGNWRIGDIGKQLEGLDYFSISNVLNNKTLHTFDSKGKIYEEPNNKFFDLQELKELDNVENILVGDGFIEFNSKWRLGIEETEDNFILTNKNTKMSYIWSNRGVLIKKTYNALFDKSKKSNNIFFGNNILRFGQNWYIGEYDENVFSICNKERSITIQSYNALGQKKYEFEDIIVVKNCKIIKNQGKYDINKKFKKALIFRYKTDEESIYYKRITKLPKDFDLYSIILEQFTDKNNKLGKDFNLYSTLNDLLNNTNPWLFCNYNSKNVGFPRDCGRKSPEPNRWASNPFIKGCSEKAKNYTFSLMYKNDNENISISKKPHSNYSLLKFQTNEKITDIDVLKPEIEDIHLEDLDTQLKVEVDQNCPFEKLRNFRVKGKDNLYQKCCPKGFNNTKFNANYKQCGINFLNEDLKESCKNNNGFIVENIVDDKLIYNCVNINKSNNTKNIILTILVIIVLLSGTYLLLGYN